MGLTLQTLPANQDHFERLLEFARDLVRICDELAIAPILSGSLAVLAYTQDPTIAVNDIDLACSEADFPRLRQALENEGVTCHLTDWHVLQARCNDLKIEFDSTEHWMQGIDDPAETLALGGLTVRIVSRADLVRLYERGVSDTAGKRDEISMRKHRHISERLEALQALDHIPVLGVVARATESSDERTTKTGGTSASPETVVMKDEPGWSVHRIGNTVRRPTRYWSSAVHALLAYLERVGFPYAPKVLGIANGTEILTYIDGISGPDGWRMVSTDAGSATFARLLRRYHDAVVAFQPPADATWAFTKEPPRRGEIICHGDFGPWNVVWKNKQPVGILDWDFAYPGPALDDVAYALEYIVPFRDDAHAFRWMGYDVPPDRKRRLRIFTEAYGLDWSGDFVQLVADRQRLTATHAQTLRSKGVTPQADWPTVEELIARAEWSERNSHLFR